MLWFNGLFDKAPKAVKKARFEKALRFDYRLG